MKRSFNNFKELVSYMPTLRSLLTVATLKNLNTCKYWVFCILNFLNVCNMVLCALGFWVILPVDGLRFYGRMEMNIHIHC